MDLLVSNKMKSIANRPLHSIDISNLNIAFPICKQTKSIQIIIGSDNFYKIATGNVQHIDKQLKIIETCFGWTFHGAFTNERKHQDVTAMFTSCINIDDSLDLRLFWNNQLAGIMPLEENHEFEEVLDQFEKNIIFQNNRYTVRLPWVPNRTLTSNLKQQAYSRLFGTTKRSVSYTHLTLPTIYSV